jgi:hypothetical protein
MSNATSQTQSNHNALPSEAESFSFLDGHWQVSHRKLKEVLVGCEEWTVFTGTARFSSLLDGLVSVEELRDANGAPFGGAVRCFDRTRRVWSDRWVSARDGILQDAVEGRMEGDVGTFTSHDTINGQAILARGVWRRVSADVLTWEQACSKDDGATWELNWQMRFERTA